MQGHTYWRTKMCGDVLELFVMDLRNGKLGQRQANWIVEGMQVSSRPLRPAMSMEPTLPHLMCFPVIARSRTGM